MIRRLNGAEVEAARMQLGEVLWDCVQGGASVSFMADLTREQAGEFYRRAGQAVERGERRLWVAEMDGEVLGTVQLLLDMPPNQPHRAEVAKMLVRRSARGMGVARLLMQALIADCRAMGKRLITLDTATGSAAERLYQQLGFQAAGTIPGYALYPDGRPCATTYYYLELN
jgi:GNAT superfamily N-acetyltransferase